MNNTYQFNYPNPNNNNSKKKQPKTRKRKPVPPAFPLPKERGNKCCNWLPIACREIKKRAKELGNKRISVIQISINKSICELFNLLSIEYNNNNYKYIITPTQRKSIIDSLINSGWNNKLLASWNGPKLNNKSSNWRNKKWEGKNGYYKLCKNWADQNKYIISHYLWCNIFKSINDYITNLINKFSNIYNNNLLNKFKICLVYTCLYTIFSAQIGFPKTRPLPIFVNTAIAKNIEIRKYLRNNFDKHFDIYHWKEEETERLEREKANNSKRKSKPTPSQICAGVAERCRQYSGNMIINNFNEFYRCIHSNGNIGDINLRIFQCTVTFDANGVIIDRKAVANKKNLNKNKSKPNLRLNLPKPANNMNVDDVSVSPSSSASWNVSFVADGDDNSNNGNNEHEVRIEPPVLPTVTTLPTNNTYNSYNSNSGGSSGYQATRGQSQSVINSRYNALSDTNIIHYASRLETDNARLRDQLFRFQNMLDNMDMYTTVANNSNTNNYQSNTVQSYQTPPQIPPQIPQQMPQIPQQMPQQIPQIPQIASAIPPQIEECAYDMHRSAHSMRRPDDDCLYDNNAQPNLYTQQPAPIMQFPSSSTQSSTSISSGSTGSSSSTEYYNYNNNNNNNPYYNNNNNNMNIQHEISTSPSNISSCSSSYSQLSSSSSSASLRQDYRYSGYCPDIRDDATFISSNNHINNNINNMNQYNNQPSLYIDNPNANPIVYY